MSVGLPRALLWTAVCIGCVLVVVAAVWAAYLRWRRQWRDVGEEKEAVLMRLLDMLLQQATLTGTEFLLEIGDILTNLLAAVSVASDERLVLAMRVAFSLATALAVGASLMAMRKWLAIVGGALFEARNVITHRNSGGVVAPLAPSLQRSLRNRVFRLTSPVLNSITRSTSFFGGRAPDLGDEAVADSVGHYHHSLFALEAEQHMLTRSIADYRLIVLLGICETPLALMGCVNIFIYPGRAREGGDGVLLVVASLLLSSLCIGVRLTCLLVMHVYIMQKREVDKLLDMARKIHEDDGGNGNGPDTHQQPHKKLGEILDRHSEDSEEYEKTAETPLPKEVVASPPRAEPSNDDCEVVDFDPDDESKDPERTFVDELPISADRKPTIVAFAERSTSEVLRLSVRAQPQAALEGTRRASIACPTDAGAAASEVSKELYALLGRVKRASQNAQREMSLRSIGSSNSSSCQNIAKETGASGRFQILHALQKSLSRLTSTSATSKDSQPQSYRFSSRYHPAHMRSLRQHSHLSQLQRAEQQEAASSTQQSQRSVDQGSGHSSMRASDTQRHAQKLQQPPQQQQPAPKGEGVKLEERTASQQRASLFGFLGRRATNRNSIESRSRGILNAVVPYFAPMKVRPSDAEADTDAGVEANTDAEENSWRFEHDPNEHMKELRSQEKLRGIFGPSAMQFAPRTRLTRAPSEPEDFIQSFADGMIVQTNDDEEDLAHTVMAGTTGISSFFAHFLHAEMQKLHHLETIRRTHRERELMERYEGRISTMTRRISSLQSEIRELEERLRQSRASIDYV